MSTDARDVSLAVVPMGSANDYAFSLESQFGRSELDDPFASRVDVGVVQLPERRRQHFVEGLGIGLTGVITEQSRQIGRRSGLWLYGMAAFRVLWRRPAPLPLRITWNDEPPVDANTLLLSILLGQREGNVRMAKQALLDDGQFDAVHGGALSPWEALRMLPRFLLHGPPADHPLISLRRCRRLHVQSPEPLTIHADGELLARAQDDVHDVEVEILPLRLNAKVCRL